MATKAIARTRIVYRKAKVHHRRRTMELPIAPLAGLYVGMQPVISSLMAGNYKGAGENLIYRYTPYNPWNKRFDTGGMWQGFVPLLSGIVVHKIANKVGINRALRNAGVPFIRI